MQPLLKRYPEKILISGMDERGCAIGTSNGIRCFNPLSLDTPVIDTNGAGDGLAIGFLSSYFIEKLSLVESVHRGQIVACYTCSQKANTSNLISKKS